jgi:hypothetical protein
MSLMVFTQAQIVQDSKGKLKNNLSSQDQVCLSSEIILSCLLAALIVDCLNVFEKGELCDM